MRDKPVDMCAWAYIAYYRSQFKKHTWACDYAENLVQTDPPSGLQFILGVLDLCHKEEEIAYVASGILEDILHSHLNDIRTNIEEILPENHKVRLALRFVWASPDSLVHRFLQDIQIKTTRRRVANPRQNKPTAVDE